MILLCSGKTTKHQVAHTDLNIFTAHNLSIITFHSSLFWDYPTEHNISFHFPDYFQAHNFLKCKNQNELRMRDQMLGFSVEGQRQKNLDRGRASQGCPLSFPLLLSRGKKSLQKGVVF